MPSMCSEHNNRRTNTCKDCALAPCSCTKAADGRLKFHCEECRPSGLCVHSRQKSQCKDCGTGQKKCPHGRQKSVCKDCGGSGICEHGRRKYQCKECVGSTNLPTLTGLHLTDLQGPDLCVHRRQKSQCKEPPPRVSWKSSSVDLRDRSR